jgi:hypothetical protein
LLARRRDDCNRTFEACRSRYPAIDGEAFLAVFSPLAGVALGSVSALCRRPGAVEQDAVETAVMGLYQAVLDLAGRGRLREGEGGAQLERLLRSLIVSFPRALAGDPGRFIRSVDSALRTVAGHAPNSRERWEAALLRLAPLDLDLPALLCGGLVAAWLAGLAQYREAAIAALRTLPPDAVRLTFGIAIAEDRIGAFAGIMAADPWADPAAAATGDRRTTPGITMTGGFTGFGGTFDRPPLLSVADGTVVCVCGDRCFRLAADRFGTAVLPDPAHDASNLPVNAAATRVRDGRVTLGGMTIDLRPAVPLDGIAAPQLEGLPVSSAAFDGTTLYLTSHRSYQVFIIGGVAA